ncbi:MAG: bifunctional riboflavin kinase/FAD synthetase [Gammaproteobacteria bacterium]|nr:bifunctional riboflavin kinase/FAD synthetase [Gammaproteobacteria bacterium]
MEIIRGLHNLRSRHRGLALTIGNFDGVHLGHLAILDQLADIGAREKLATAVMTFEPQPREFFAGVGAPPRLTRFKEKMLALMRTPLEHVLVLRFDESFSRVPANRFIEHYLVAGLGIRHMLVGDDFRFGHGAEGNIDLLHDASQHYGFRLTRRDTFSVAGGRVSSSWIRDALENGELEVAAQLLGRPYSILGRVAYGRRLGRTLGFPTANLPLRRRVSPIRGVFAVRVRGAGATPLEGMANVGTRPTVDGTAWVLEVHLFDFNEDLYGRELSVDFVGKLRDERRFESVDALTRQLKRDANEAKALLETKRAPSNERMPA